MTETMIGLSIVIAKRDGADFHRCIRLFRLHRAILQWTFCDHLHSGQQIGALRQRSQRSRCRRFVSHPSHMWHRRRCVRSWQRECGFR